MLRAKNYQGNDTDVFCRAVVLEIKDTSNTIKSNSGPALWGHDYHLMTLENNIIYLYERSKTVSWLEEFEGVLIENEIGCFLLSLWHHFCKWDEVALCTSNYLWAALVWGFKNLKIAGAAGLPPVHILPYFVCVCIMQFQSNVHLLIKHPTAFFLQRLWMVPPAVPIPLPSASRDSA